MNRNQKRQGDVWLEQVPGDQLPSDVEEVARDNGRIVLAYGEVTGHAHAIAERNATLFRRPGTGERWLVIRATAVESAAGVQHEEHAAIVLEPGVYRVGIQREYHPEAIRNVVD